MPDTLTCMVRAIKIVAIIGTILTITGIILLVVGGFNFVPALMKLGAMQAAAAAAQNSTGDKKYFKYSYVITMLKKRL